MSKLCIVWFRKDLRIIDNPALNAAINAGYQILPVFIDYSAGAALNIFKHYALLKLSQDLDHKLIICKGNPQELLRTLIAQTRASAIYWNRLYEPDSISRNIEIKKQFSDLDIKSFNSSLLLEPWEVTKLEQQNDTQLGPYNTKNPNLKDSHYKVFTAYYKRHQAKFSELNLKAKLLSKKTSASIKNSTCDLSELLARNPQELNSQKPELQLLKLEELELLPKIQWQKGIEEFWGISKTTGISDPQKQITNFCTQKVEQYPDLRNRPDLDGISKLSPYLALGVVSPQMIYAELFNPSINLQSRSKILKSETSLKNTINLNTTSRDEYLRQLGWRDFAYHLLYYTPSMINEAQNPKFKNFPWQNSPSLLSAWQKGLTGYPIVDAGMRELWHTGWMHNRVRMIVASFLVKDLLIDWRKGAEWFWETLVDADLANNTMGWQWCAGCGVDAAPYFRIFNPVLQGEKFDPDGNYVRHWIPELSKLPNKWIHQPFNAPALILNEAGVKLGDNYPQPIIDHKYARDRALSIYQSLASKTQP